MKRLLKKPVNRGAPKCAPLLLLLMVVGILSLARARPVEASTSTVTSYDLYCYSALQLDLSTSRMIFKSNCSTL